MKRLRQSVIAFAATILLLSCASAPPTGGVRDSLQALLPLLEESRFREFKAGFVAARDGFAALPDSTGKQALEPAMTALSDLNVAWSERSRGRTCYPRTEHQAFVAKYPDYRKSVTEWKAKAQCPPELRSSEALFFFLLSESRRRIEAVR